MAQITLKDISKRYESTTDPTLKDINLTINEGEFVVFIGPSGCGKSTMLRMIAGLEDISSGELRFDEDVVNELTPAERKVGMVFQSYALYPHMTVRENIAFGVKFNKDWKKKDVSQAVLDIAEALELTAYLDEKPAALSGGQRQRVAIGRALIRKPSVFLLDEPLSNLDAALRSRMRQKIAEFHRQFRSTTIYVTHDQIEAMTLADKVVILNNGGIEQVGSPLELFNYPRTEFVAEFIGTPKMNMLDATFLPNSMIIGDVKLPACSDLESGAGKIGVRPEALNIDESGEFSGKIVNIEYLGSETILFIKVNNINEDVILRTTHNVHYNIGNTLSFSIDTQQIHVFQRGVRK